ncbi:NAD(P)H-hydrate dehydratase [Candidatus Beckwithbacteria bacterium]|nr:NAD(P)H-hydrate dehydratase [Candidatus Beckwithbacteria bacterium]
MEYVEAAFLQKLKLPNKDSHKGQNGRLTIVGGSKLFHGASLWALVVASRIVDMVYYASVVENQKLVEHLEKNLYAFINIPLGKEADYITESDAVLIGPGMVRGDANFTGTGETGEETKKTVLQLLKQFPDKKWVLDAGALQVINPEVLQSLNQVIITPHHKEFKTLFELEAQDETIMQMAQTYNCTILLKGKVDTIVSPGGRVIYNQTGNEGMTKGGTGDVLAGLVAVLACTNDLFTAAAAGAYINGLAGDKLYQTVGPLFNADDLAKIVPEILWQEIKK